MKKILLAVLIVSAALILTSCGMCSTCQSESNTCCGSNSYTGNWY